MSDLDNICCIHCGSTMSRHCFDLEACNWVKCRGKDCTTIHDTKTGRWAPQAKKSA